MASLSSENPDAEMNSSAVEEPASGSGPKVVEMSPSSRPRSLERRESLSVDSKNPSVSDIEWSSRSPSKREWANTVRQDSSNTVAFIEPIEGSEAHEALQANKEIKMSSMTKFLSKSFSMKPKFLGKGKRKQKKFDKNFKGKVIDGKHELYVLSMGMMLGIRCAVGGTHNPIDSPLFPKDFSYVQRLNFPKEGSSIPGNITPSHSLAHSFKFKSYAPKVFEKLRSLFDIEVSEFMLSVCGNSNYLEFISNSKSGQFFFYSHDGKYMIKTQSKEENKFLMRILPQYVYKIICKLNIDMYIGTTNTFVRIRILCWCVCWGCTVSVCTT